MSFSSNVFLLLRCRLWINQYGTRTELIFSSSKFSVCSIESIAYNCYRCFRERVFFWMYFIFLEWTLNWWNRHTHKEIQTPKTTHKHTQTRKSQLAVSPCEVVLRWTSTLWKVCLLMVSSGAAWQRRPEPKATGTEKLKSIEMCELGRSIVHVVTISCRSMLQEATRETIYKIDELQKRQAKRETS